ncbi:MAG: nodulation protein NfeD [Actinomycetota bacterium]|nr:nodulation protein NfeD [Actinomycetota bacterium]
MAPARTPSRRTSVLALAAAVVLLTLTFVIDAVAPPTAAGAATQGPPRVLATTVEATITPVVADHLVDGIARAARDGYDAYVVRLDTPGGLDTSMRRIVRHFLSARVPVIVYVSPQGSRAASAGAIITFAAHIAAMAPGTTIGAATPVDLEGGDVERKVVNDAAAFAESIARLRGRNVEFAGATVREGRAVPAVEAVELGAVDLLVPSLLELLEAVDGRQVELADEREVRLRTARAVVNEHDLGLLRRIQQHLADPNLAFLFLSLGSLGLIYELATPGLGGAGVVGALSMLIGLFALAVLPVNVVGLLLLALAVALFVVEVLAPGIGVAAVGGAVSLLLSGVFLFRGVPGVGVSASVVLPIAVVVGGAVVVAGRLATGARNAPSTTTGPGLFVGRQVTVARVTGAAAGQAFVEGAWWAVRSRDGELHAGQEVRVVDVEGLDLVVEASERAGDEDRTQQDN